MSFNGESTVKLLLTNYVDIDILVNTAVSSEQSEFPVLNAYNKQRRSKVWRSAGYFEVTSSNNTIIFRETTGVDLTATITAAEYTSISSMVSAVESALNAAGASTYRVTCASSDGYKFKIVSNGSGGGGVFHLMLTDASFTAEDLLGFDNSADLTDAVLTRTADYLRINTEEFIEWDMGLPTNPKAFALIGARNEPLKISQTATIKLEGNSTNNWTTPNFSTTLTYSDLALWTINKDGLATNAERYWRIQISDQNPLGYIQVGAFFLGDYFNPTRGRVQFGVSHTMIDPSVRVESEGGQSFADIKPVRGQYAIIWRHLQKADIEDFENEFLIYGRNKPFFIHVDPAQGFTSNDTRRVLFVKLAADPVWTLETFDNFTLSMVVTEEL